MNLENIKINFLGDSITFGALATTPEKSYLGLLQEKYPNSLFRRYGSGGSSIANQHVWEVATFCQRAEEMDPDADAVVIFGGTNDFGTCVPLGTPEDRTEDTFYGACFSLFRKVLEKFPGKPIIVVTPLHRTFECAEEYQGRKLVAPLEEYVRIMKETAKYFAFPVVDLYATSGLQPAFDFICESFMPDGLHPNDAGHEILFKKLDAALRLL